MTQIDTTDCESEPIRFPGAVLPHGALLILNASGSGAIEAVSASCTAILGLPPDRLIGRLLPEILGAAAADDLVASRPSGLRPLCALSLGGRALSARAHENESGQLLIDIESDGAAPGLNPDTLYSLRRGIAALRNQSDLETIFGAAAAWMRDVTGYDRVMVYRFDAAWNGEVVAEARSPDVKSYLGHHFPAGDIPKQARELARNSGPRMIVDVRHTPSPLLGTGDPRLIDLGPSSLRAVSPIHIQYMKNMGVEASLVGTLVVDGRLWGHLSCHHESGRKYLGPAARDAFGWACEDVAALIGATQTRQLQEREHALSALRQRLVQKIRSADFNSLMQDRDSDDLLEVVGADGFALVMGHQVQVCGCTPSADQIKRLQGACKERASDPDFFASSALARDLGDRAASDGIAGALFVSAPQIPDVALAWFRRERRHAIRWRGDPNHAHLIDADGRLTPRTSFDLFLQDIAGTSRNWTPEEQFSAKELTSLIEIELLRKEVVQSKVREQKMRASEERFRMLVEDAPDAILLYDHDQDRFVATNKAAERLFGVSREEILQHGPMHFYAPEQPDARAVAQTVLEHNERALRGEELKYERRIRRPSGEERVCRVTLIRLPSNVRLLRASFVDISEQRVAEAQLSEVLRDTVAAQEAERGRIARELHDSVSQYLAASNMRLEMFARSVPDGSPLKPGIAELKNLTLSIEDEVGRLAWELRPIALDDIGIEPAIRGLVEEWAHRGELQFDVHLDLNGRRLSPLVETTLYRVLQEAITNVVRHSAAGRVGIILRRDAGRRHDDRRRRRRRVRIEDREPEPPARPRSARHARTTRAGSRRPGD